MKQLWSKVLERFETTISGLVLRSCIRRTVNGLLSRRETSWLGVSVLCQKYTGREHVSDICVSIAHLTWLISK